jgi:hypothetical protein
MDPLLQVDEELHSAVRDEAGGRVALCYGSLIVLWEVVVSVDWEWCGPCLSVIEGRQFY